MRQVAILLTTYNSSVFLKELIVSLFSQTFGDWLLYIRDDGSTDKTLDIIRHFMEEDKRIHFLHDDCKRGAMQGFLWLLQQVDAEYYMFCDHDDVWQPNKVEVTLKKMLSVGTDTGRPIVVHTDLTVVDAHLNVLECSFWKSQHIQEREFNDKYYHLVYNNVTGCTMMINAKAKDVSLPVHPYAQMHDSWIVASVLWNGGVVLAVHEQTILYRQHGKNTIGANELPGIGDKFHRLKSLIRKTNRQYVVAKYLSGIGFLHFWLLKLYCMCLIYMRDYKNLKRR